MPKQTKKYSESSESSESSENSDNNSSETDSDSESSDTDDSINDTSETEYNDDDIRNIIYEDINESYAYARLGELDVIMMKKNGYINATKLCHKNKKEFKNWYQNRASKELIKVAEASAGYPAAVILKRLQEPHNTRGTYVHPKIIVHVASWCSPNYALMVSDIVTEYHTKYAIEEKEKLIKKKDDKIDKMGKKIDKLLNKNDKLLEKNDMILKKNDMILKKNDMLLKDNEDFRRRDDIMSTKVDHLVDEIDIKSDNYVVEGNPNTRHILVIIKTNELPKKIKNKKGRTITSIPQFDYIALRVMKKSYKSRINSIKKEFPDMDILLEIKYTLNSMNLWGRIKKELNRKKIAVTGSRFKRLVGYSEKRMIREIQKIHDERFEYDD